MNKKYSKDLDKLGTTCDCMYSAIPEFNELHPELTRLECNDIVLDWIKERSYYVSYQKKTEEGESTKTPQGYKDKTVKVKGNVQSWEGH